MITLDLYVDAALAIGWSSALHPDQLHEPRRLGSFEGGFSNGAKGSVMLECWGVNIEGSQATLLALWEALPSGFAKSSTNDI